MRTPLILALGMLTVSARASAAETLIDDFESGTSAWTFYNGAEFPGATGSLTSGAGHASAKGATLAYDIAGTSHYVSITRTLPTPLTMAALGFWAQSPGGIHTTTRVTDSMGQTLQYAVNRPLEAFDAAAWYRLVIDLSAPSSHYGGPNDGVVHQPIQSVTLMAADPQEAGATGLVKFDDVVAIDTLAPRVDPSATLVARAPGEGALSAAGRVGVNIHFTKDDHALDLAGQAGFTFVRMDLGWSGVEHTKGVYDFTALDGLVASLATRNMGLLLILDYFNALYPAADSPDYATVTVPAFAAVAKSAATHFAGKNVRFEIWNEPNLDGFWPPKADASQYAVLCKAGIAAVHEGNATAQVTTAGVSQFDFAYVRAVLAAGGGTGADAVGVHPYRQGGAESLSDDLVLMKSIAAPSFSSTPPIWATEWGYSSTWYGSGHDDGPLQKQAVYATRELLSSWALGVPLLVYYDIRDDGTDPTNAEHNFGLLGNDYTDKPAMVAVRTLFKAVAGYSFAGFLPIEPSSMHAMLLTSGSSRKVVLWSDAVGSSNDVIVPNGTTVVDALGRAPGLGVNGNDTFVVVGEFNGPVYLTLPAGVSSKDGGVTSLGDGAVASTGGASGNANAGSGAVATGGVAGGAPSGSGSASGSGGTTSGTGATAGADASMTLLPSRERDSSGCGCTLARTATSSPVALGASIVGLFWLRRKRRRAARV